MSASSDGAGPGLEPCGLLSVEVEEPLDLAASPVGVRRAVRVVGGRLSGALGAGDVIGGWDWQTVLPDGTLWIDATYPVRLDGGEMVTVNTVGVRDPSSSPPYFRLAVRIVGPDVDGVAAHRLLIASGRREAGQVSLTIYQVT